MFILKKPDDILPLILALCGIAIAYYCPLYSAENVYNIDSAYFNNVLSLDITFVKNYADTVSRVSFCIFMVYALFLYYCYFSTMTLSISIVLIANNIFYMALLANAVPMPSVDFYPLLCSGVLLWQCCFLMPKTTFYLGLSSLIFMAIAYINPVASILFGGALVLSAMIIRCLNTVQTGYFYNILFMFLCGFCSLTASLITTKSVLSFDTMLQKYYHFPLIISAVLLILIVSYQIHKKYLMRDTPFNTAAMMICYCIMLFVGSVFMGRFDYIAHFA